MWLTSREKTLAMWKSPRMTPRMTECRQMTTLGRRGYSDLIAFNADVGNNNETVCNYELHAGKNP